MKHDARYYWEKLDIVDKCWHNALECMSEDSSPTLVTELINIHKLMDILKNCAEKHEQHEDRRHDQHEEHHGNPRPHHNPHRGSGAFGT